MLKKLSYLNLALAFFYYLGYLINSYSYAALGLLGIVISNIFLLHNIDKDLPLRWPHYLFQAFSIVFAGFLITWAVNIFVSSLEYNDFGESWVYLVVTVSFAICIITQSVFLYIKSPGSN